MDAAPWGGSEALWVTTALYALKQKDEVFVSVSKWVSIHPQLKLLQEKGAVVNFRKRLNDDYTFLEKVSRFIKKSNPSLNRDFQDIFNFKPDIVFISQGETFDFTLYHKQLYDLLMFKKISYSLVCHNIVQQYSYIPPKEIYPGAIKVFKNAKHVFFVSFRQWNLTERRLICKLKNAEFTWNPLNLSLPLRPLSWKKNGVIQMAIVASFLLHKGQDTVFEILSSEKWKKRDWKLNLYGKGEGEDYLKNLAVFYGIQNNVEFCGHVADIKNIWRNNHILLIPSAQDGLPISLVEAMACGRPAVVTDVGGNTELIAENKTGFIAASPSVDSFSNALDKAWSKKSEWEQLGINSFILVNEKIDKAPEIKLYETLKSSITII